MEGILLEQLLRGWDQASVEMRDSDQVFKRALEYSRRGSLLRVTRIGSDAIHICVSGGNDQVVLARRRMAQEANVGGAFPNRLPTGRGNQSSTWSISSDRVADGREKRGRHQANREVSKVDYWASEGGAF